MPARLKGSIIALSALALALSCPARAADGYLFDAAQAPTGASAPTSPAPPTVREPQQSAFPDESALRYYASRNETQRVNAEIARLKRFYPNWLPPKDLYDTLASGEQDETVLWDLFADDRMDDLAAAIAARKAAEPDWRPSQDLQQKIRRKTARLKINDFLKQSRWQDIVDYVHDANTMADAEVDILWAVAEAFARTKQAPEAMRIYASILTNDKNPGERLATIQKAMAVLRMADVEPLIAMGVKPQDGSSEFAPIMVDITRARIAAYLHDERVQDVVDADMRLFENFARAAADPNQSALVGWYDYKHKNYRDALEWFKLSIAHGGDAMIAHGLAHTLRSLGYLREAEEVSYAWREPLVNNSILFIDILQTDLTREIPPYVEPDRLYRYAQESLRVASGEGAQALAWYAYNTCQFDTALAWFERATAWAPKEATAYGYALTVRRIRGRKAFFDVANRYDGLFPKVIELIFPDNFYHPPTPCARASPARLEEPTRAVGGIPVPKPSRFAPEELAALSALDIKLRSQFEMTQRPDRAPSIAKGDFPAAVDPENNLRYSAFDARIIQSSLAPSEVAMAQQGTPLNMPLVARRVPGAGPMPYERYGFTLLPAYDGQTNATGPLSPRYAPAGTPWAEQQAEQEAPAPTAIFVPDWRSPSPLLTEPVRPQAASGVPAIGGRQAQTIASEPPANLASLANAYHYGNH
jgi:cellulose synthase operon protein C